MTADVSLREVDAANVRAVCDLQLLPGQERHVAPAAVTIAQAAYEADGWLRAIYAGEEPVGLIYGEPHPDEDGWWLGRMLVDARRQGTGLGRAAMALVVAYVRSLDGVRALYTSYVPGPDEPRAFYLGLGFQETGAVEDDEIVLRLGLHG